MKKTSFAGGVTISNGPVVFNEVGDNPNASTALIQILGPEAARGVAPGVRRGEVRVPAAQAVGAAVKVFVFDLLPYGEHLEHLKQGKELPWPLPRRHFKPEVAVRTYDEHLDGLGGDGPPRLRRRRLQRAPHLALRPDELAQPAGGGGRAAHAAHQAADLRQPAAAPRPAAAGRGAGDARLPVQRAHRLRLRARHPARAQRLPRAADGVARPLRGGVGDHPPRVDGGGRSPTTGRFWSYEDVAIWPRPGAAAAPAGVGAGHRQQGDDRVGGPPQHSDHARPGAARAACARTSSATTRAAWRSTATGSRPTT